MASKRWLLAVLMSVGLLSLASPATGEAELDSREISFSSAGYRLRGTLTGPAHGSPVAGVLIVPGSGPVDRDGASRLAPTLPAVYRQWAERLGAAGFVVLRYDKRFLTYPNLDVAAFDQEAQIADARAAVVALRAQPGLSARRVFIVGHSEGGTIAPLVAERAGPISGVVIVNSVQFPVDELILAQLQARPDVSGSAIEDVRRRFGEVRAGSFPPGGLLLGAGAGYWAQWMSYSRAAPQALSRLTMPLLLIQCMKDETLPGGTLARNVALLRTVAAAKSDAQLRELGGHDHLAMVSGEKQVSSEFTRIVVEWLNETVRRPAPAGAGSR